MLVEIYARAGESGESNGQRSPMDPSARYDRRGVRRRYFASLGVNPMIWTPAPRATSIASITSW
jgi:hypothetical protein